MSTAVPSPGMGESSFAVDRATVEQVAKYWWLSLVTGVMWIVAALVVLQFDQASITTVGVIIGLMFAAAAAQQFVLAAVAERLRWLWALFGVIFAVAAILCFVHPENTFAGVADILGFLFLSVGVFWIVRSFVEGQSGAVFWLGLISGVMMIILAFWTSGQFFIEKAYTLLVFAGIWGLMHGVTDIVRAFAVRSLRDKV
jgi:uncharacterized membrane protein HdeD (DUF308 family)